MDASYWVKRTPKQRAQAAARYDREARESLAAYAARKSQDVTVPRPIAPEPRRVTGRMQYMRDGNGATVLVPWNHPEAVAWRQRKAVAAAE